MKPTLLLLVVAAAVVCAVKDEPYLQSQSARYTYQSVGQLASWPVLSLNGVTALANPLDKTYGSIVALTNDALYSISEPVFGEAVVSRIDNTMGIAVTSDFVMAASEDLGYLLLASSSALYLCPSALTPCKTIAPSYAWGKVHDIKMCLTGDVYVGSDSGLHVLVAGSTSIQRLEVIDEAVTCVACGPAMLKETVSAGTGDKVWRNDAFGMWRFEWSFAGNIDEPATGLAFTSDGYMWIPNSESLSRWAPVPDFTFKRFGAYEGLPFANLTAVSRSNRDILWFASTMGGVIRYDTKINEWRLFRGPRWLTGSQITAVSVDYSQTGAWVADEKGISHIAFNEMTLATKAAMMDKLNGPQFFRNYLVGDVSLSQWGNINNSTGYPNDNNGLWTAIYLASQCYRYAVTKDPQVKANAWKSFEAMEMLNNITGIDGLMARSFISPGEPRQTGSTWYDSEIYPGYMFKADASSDEVVGHMLVYPIVHDLLAETPAEKARALRLINNTMSYILENGFYLIDVTGKPTQWGRWAPEVLNNDMFWYDERGLNSVQILGWLLSAYTYTGEQKFINAFNGLVKDHQYDVNMINTKIIQPEDDNFSDDELSFFSYLCYINAAKKLGATDDKYALKDFKLGVTRNYEIRIPEKVSMWNIIYGYMIADPSNAHMDDAMWTLQRWPLDLVNWEYKNSDRQDVVYNIYTDRMGNKDNMSTRILSPEERGTTRLNSCFFEMDGNNSQSATDASAWLMSYWMARYLGYLV